MPDVPLLILLMYVVVAYISGHVIAHLAALALDNRVVRRWLPLPEQLLFEGASGWRAKLFPGYFTPLPADTRNRVLARAAKDGISDQKQDLFSTVTLA